MARIAIVDADPDTVEIISRVLNEAGHQLIPIIGSEGALDRVREGMPDLVILDPWLESPTVGWEILAALVADERTRSIPVIICSGDALELRDRQSWIEARQIPVVGKPFELTHLEDAIADLLASISA